jgi:hypothetical protein
VFGPGQWNNNPASQTKAGVGRQARVAALTLSRVGVRGGFGVRDSGSVPVSEIAGCVRQWIRVTQRQRVPCQVSETAVRASDPETAVLVSETAGCQTVDSGDPETGGSVSGVRGSGIAVVSETAVRCQVSVSETAVSVAEK